MEGSSIFTRRENASYDMMRFVNMLSPIESMALPNFSFEFFEVCVSVGIESSHFVTRDPQDACSHNFEHLIAAH